MTNDEILNNESGLNDSVVDTDTDYISAIKELKANSVSKDKYLKVQEDNRRLLNALTNGQTIDTVDAKPETVDVSALRKDMFSGNLSNLDFVEKSLKLRDELIKEGHPDPFLPIGSRISPTEEDINTVNRVAQVFQECIDYADGDSSVFTNELSRRTLDIKLPSKR